MMKKENALFAERISISHMSFIPMSGIAPGSVGKRETNGVKHLI